MALSSSHGRGPLRTRTLHGSLATAGLIMILALSLAGCAQDQEPAPAEEATATTGAHMAGPEVDVNIAQSVIDKKPAAPVLTDPESAVRSYLAWTTYAYRTSQSEAALPTMTTYEEVRVDAYVQYNLQQFRLLDQTLDLISFGAIAVDGDTATVPTHEEYTYSYLSVGEGNEVIGGPFEAAYDVVYTLVKNDEGNWVVDKVEATALGKVE